MKYILDTCVVSDFFKKIPNVISQFEKNSPSLLAISSITVLEVEYGLAINPERAIKLEPLWKALIRQIQIIPFTNEDARITAQLQCYLKNKGTLIGAYDALLAGTALNRKVTFVTSNTREFIRVPHLRLEDWRKNISQTTSIEA